MTNEEFEKLAGTLRSLMVKTALSFFGNKDDAEDAAQESLLHLWTLRDRIDSRRGQRGTHRWRHPWRRSKLHGTR